jgi:DNA primase
MICLARYFKIMPSSSALMMLRSSWGIWLTAYYHQTLKASPEALAYLEKRGIAGAVDHFRLGYANRTLGLRLPEKNRQAGEAIRGRLQTVGVLRESGHEHLNGCVVFPWFDEAGTVAGLYGRKIVENQARNLPKHLYLPGPRRGVFNAEGVCGQQEVIVCEAIIDALTFWCAGYTNVTAAFGVEGFTEEHAALFRASGVERVIIAFDRDRAGDAGAVKLAERLMRAPPARSLLRAGCGRYAPSAPCSQPSSPSAPEGLPVQPPAAESNSNEKARSACGASR